MTIYRSEKGEFPATLRDTMNHEQLCVYERAAHGIQDTLGWKQWKADDLNPVAEVFQVPMTYDQLCLISRLLLPLTSDDYQCEDCPTSMFDYIHSAIRQVSHDHLSQAFISIYEVDRCYGGPEEGGWWYDHWTHLGSDSYDTQEALAHAFTAIREEYPYMGNALTTDELLKQYEDFVSGEGSYCIDRYEAHEAEAKGGFPHGFHQEWYSRAHETHYILLDDTSHGRVSSVYLVFEWAPGMAATVSRPHYC